MIRNIALSIVCLAAVMAGLWASAQIEPAVRPLAEWMPRGALLYLESSDFGSQLRDWNRSGVKSDWLASKNYEAFLTTRLVLKLKEVYAEFSAAAGVAPNLTDIEGIAGTVTAFALYDIGKLDFAYISRLPVPSPGQNVLNLAQASFETRSAAGVPYFIRQSGNRTAAFAFVGPYVVVSTREDLISEALALIQGNVGASVSQETWYRDAVQELPSDGTRPVAFRLVMDFPSVIATPYFRSYWIQENTSELGQYYAFLSEVTRSSGAIEENRVLLRMDAVDVLGNEAAAVDLQRYVPDDAGFFRLWDNVSSDFAVDLIQQKYFGGGPASADAPRYAPGVVSGDPVGSEADLQLRIDAAPKPSLAGALNLVPLKALVDSARLEAVLHLESSVSVDDVGYVRSDAAVALKASSPWNAASVKSALTAAVASYQTVADIGLQWRRVDSGGFALSQWDGLIPLTIYVDGQILWIARTPSLVTSALQHAASATRAAGPAGPARAAGPAGPVNYLARYRHHGELASYLKLMRMLDLSDPSNFSGFFSENVGSLASALEVIDSAFVRTTDTGLVRRETVRYELGR